MLSLSPRFDLFRFIIPKEFIPVEIEAKWTDLLNKNQKNYIRTPIDIINESIQGISISGISDGIVEQEQTGVNLDTNKTEPQSTVTYRSSANPLSLMEQKINITFRHTQGFYNYFLMYESWFYHHMKSTQERIPFFIIEVLSESGVVMSHLILRYPVFSSIDELALSFNKVDRSNDTFTCTFAFSDIDFEFGPPETNKSLSFVL